MQAHESTYHAPVMLQECLDALELNRTGVFVDVTFGGGGHSAAILQQMGEGSQLFGFDQDEDAEKNARKAPFEGREEFIFIRSNFRYMHQMLRAFGVGEGKVLGILADLGVSSYQIDTPSRGFSYRFDHNLDMRMNTSDGPSAADLLNTMSAEDLQRILSEFGELRNARTLAQAIVHSRGLQPFRTTGQLVQICEKHMMGDRFRYLSQVFQALRMEVNDEVGALSAFLNDCRSMLAPGGRLVVMTYHSIEDRFVKNLMKTGNAQGEVIKDFFGNIERPFELVHKKPIEASAQEVKTNPRARSAKLRVATLKSPDPKKTK
jgi:16S rRNA (cytosine1402-N4)-methyltransferase